MSVGTLLIPRLSKAIVNMTQLMLTYRTERGKKKGGVSCFLRRGNMRVVGDALEGERMGGWGSWKARTVSPPP